MCELDGQTRAGRPARPLRSGRIRGGLVILAVILGLIRIGTPRVTVYTGSDGGTVNLGQAHALCASWLGTLAQAANSGAARDCTAIGYGYDLLNVVMVGAVVCLAAALALWVAGQTRRAA